MRDAAAGAASGSGRSVCGRRHRPGRGRRGRLDDAAEGRGGARGRQRIEEDLLEEQVLRRRELVRIGSNLNQFLRLAHQGKAGILPDALRELLIKLREQVAAEATAR